MEKKKVCYFKLFFLAALIFSFPFNTAIAFAELDVKVKNSKNLENFVKSDDFLIFEATASIKTDDDITPEQITLGDKKFDSCTLGIDGFVCTLRQPPTGTSKFNSFSYTVKLANDNDEIVDTFNSNVVLDNIAPVISSFSISPKKTSGNANLNFIIHDSATSDDVCSGIDKIDFYQDSYSGKLLKSETIDTKDCDYSGSTLYLTNLNSGNIKICARAYDKAGVFSTEQICDDFEVDKLAPSVVPDSFQILDSDNYPINYVPNQEMPAILYVNLSSPDIDLINVFAELKELNPLYEVPVQGQCTSLQDVVNCVWELQLNLQTSGSRKIKINFSDILGNFNTAEFSQNFIEDKTVPVPSSITSRTVDGKFYATTLGTNFTAVFTELESGFKPKDVFLHLDEKSYSATYCGLNRCFWENLIFSTNKKSIKAYIGSDTRDKAGNPSKELSIDVLVDSVKPEIMQLTHEPKSPSSKEDLFFEVFVKEADSKPTVYSDVSSISSDNFASGECQIVSEQDIGGLIQIEDKRGIYLCKLAITNLISSYTESEIEIIVEDSAGNKDSKKGKITIYEADIDTKPNFISLKKDDIYLVPSKLSRKGLSLIPLPLFINVPLNPKNADVVDKSVMCDNARLLSGSDTTSDVEIVDTPFLIDKDTNNPSIVVKIKPEGNILDGNLIRINCELSLKIKRGTKLFAEPEKELINVTVPLFDVPLGSVDNAIQSKINDSLASINKIQSDIDYWQDWKKVLSTICGIVMTIAQIDSVLQKIYMVLNIASCKLDFLFFLRKPLTAACVPLNYFHVFVRNFVWDPGAIPTGVGVGYFFKWVCLINSCRLADPAFYGEIALSLGASTIRTLTAKSDGIGEMILSKSTQVLEDDLYDYVELQQVESVSTISADKDFIRVNLRNDKKGYNYQYDYNLNDKKTYYVNNGVRTETPISSNSDAYKSITKYVDRNKWLTQVKKTNINTPIRSSEFLWDPYKSIHYAYGTLCIPGIIYNLKKEKQINCLHVKCLRDNAIAGNSLASCDIEFKERQCLYVDSAQYKLHGWMGDIFDKVIDALFGSFEKAFRSSLAVAGTICNLWDLTAHKTECPLVIPSGACTTGVVFRPCSIVSTIQQILSFIDILTKGFDFGKFERQLDSTNFCEGVIT